jgi:hypothetical protein
MLGKSPVTIRKWQTENLFVFPNSDNKFNSEEVRDIAEKAAIVGRIDVHRKRIIEGLMAIHEVLEVVNEKDRFNRGRRIRKK